MLKGYAGTGKTTLIKGIIEYLEAKDKSYILMAPTGRAAKVLRDKTGHGITIHKGIYNFKKLESINEESKDDAEHSFHYHFPINNIGEYEHIIIVDEASMVSNVESKHELFTFGTNYLLNDLLTFAQISSGKNKIIFVGDPAQLPPVNDSRSLALDREFFEIELNLQVSEVELTEVVRQENNLILENATTIRSLLFQEKKSELLFKYDDLTFVKSEVETFIETFTNTFPRPEIGDGVVISFSNAQSYYYNQSIREKLFPGQSTLVPGDLLLINNNNYHTYGVELFNGDIAKVISVDDSIVSQSAPVYCDIDGKKEKIIISFDFKKIKIRIPTHPDEIECYIIHSLLHSTDRDLSICEMKALYINFMMRFNEEQKQRSASGLSTFKVGSEEFKQRLKSDPFFNALRVKFGEWDKVFIDYYGRVSLKNDPLRWCYTATTRGKNTVYTINAPHFSKLSFFDINPIGQIGNVPKDSLSFDSVILSPYHSNGSFLGKSAKYWEIKEKLENTNYKIKMVESKGEYLERFTILDTLKKEIFVQASHTGSGHFVEKFKVITPCSEEIKNEIQSIINADYNPVYSINYNPKSESLRDLHSRLFQFCSELDIVITNIKEGQYNVIYFLKTSSICSYIQFYYNDKEQLTTAMPKTFRCEDDIKLKSLISKLLTNVG